MARDNDVIGPVAVDPARHTRVSRIDPGPSDGVDEESTNQLDDERETAAVLERGGLVEKSSTATVYGVLPARTRGPVLVTEVDHLESRVAELEQQLANIRTAPTASG